jgi:hypothetical protein
MRRIIFIAAAFASIAFSSSAARAAGVRIVWQQQTNVSRFRLFISQPIAAGTKLMQFEISNPDIDDDGSFTTDVHGLNPLYEADFLMVSYNSDGKSDASNMLTMAPEEFCPVLDDDGDGKVTVKDALGIARRAVGIGTEDHVSEGSIVTALETLRMAAAYICR